MSIRSVDDFNSKLVVLQALLEMREEIRDDLEQSHLTENSIINKLDALKKAGVLENRRVLAIGDSDLSALSIAIFGQPSEVVVTDIDQRLSEILFEAHLEYDLPVRFVYHDMRIKIIEILRHQYNLIIMEPPLSRAGIEVFISRALMCIDRSYPSGIFITIPHQGELRQYFENYIQQLSLSKVRVFEEIIEYTTRSEKSDLIQLKLHENTNPTITYHHIRPFYSYEEKQSIHEYKCICKKSIFVGEGQQYSTIEMLEDDGCKDCGYQGKFAFATDIKLL